MLLSALLAVACAPSAAAPTPIAWEVPVQCPDRAVADATLARLLAGSPQESAPGITARVRIERAGDARFVARVQVGGDERVLAASSCDEVAEAALLIVAMAIDPRIGGPAPAVDDPPQRVQPPDTGVPPGPAPAVIPEAAAASRPEAPGSQPHVSAAPLPTGGISADPAPPRRRVRPTPRALLRVGAGIGVGGPPAPSGIVTLGAALAGSRWRVELDGDLWTPRRRGAPMSARVGAQMLAWSVGLRGCGSPIAGRFELPVCGGLRAGALRGRGTGDLRSTPASSPWLVASAGVGLWGWIAPRFALALDVEGLVALTRPAFQVDPGGLVFRAPPGGVRAVFGAVVRLP